LWIANLYKIINTWIFDLVATRWNINWKVYNTSSYNTTKMNHSKLTWSLRSHIVLQVSRKRRWTSYLPSPMPFIWCDITSAHYSIKDWMFDLTYFAGACYSIKDWMFDSTYFTGACYFWLHLFQCGRILHPFLFSYL
jgi:hypothetical protein